MIILDDFDKNNLLGILNYTSGEEFVRNFVVLDGESDGAGYNSIGFTITTPGAFIVYIGTTRYDLGTFTSDIDLMSIINTDADMQASGITATYDEDIRTYIYSDPPVPLAYSYGVKIISDGTIDYKSIVFGIDGGAVSQRYRFFEMYFLLDLRSSCTLFPYGDSQTIQASDEDSILAYGSRMHTVHGDDLITSGFSKQIAIDAKLAELKDPKARCFVDIPFDYNQPHELEPVEVRLSYQSDGQLRAFKEGGHFKGWTDSGTYRYKNFYTVGISHSKSGQHTRLRLMEKLN